MSRSVPLFHETNKFIIYKKNGDQKVINFTGHKVGLYYKLYSIQRKKHNYHSSTAGILDIAGRVLINGDVSSIISKLIKELKKEHTFTIIDTNSDGGEVYHWRDDVDGVLEQLKLLKEKYTFSGDSRLYTKLKVLNNHASTESYDTLDNLITLLTKPELELGVYLKYEEVLEEMKPLILNGTDKEKIEAKAILLYVVKKMVEAL